MLKSVQNDSSVVNFVEPRYLCCELPTPITIKYSFFRQSCNSFFKQNFQSLFTFHDLNIRSSCIHRFRYRGTVVQIRSVGLEITPVFKGLYLPLSYSIFLLQNLMHENNFETKMKANRYNRGNYSHN